MACTTTENTYPTHAQPTSLLEEIQASALQGRAVNLGITYTLDLQKH